MLLAIGIDPASAEIINGLCAVSHDMHGIFEARLGEGALNQDYIVLTIFYQQNHGERVHNCSVVTEPTPAGALK
jgi:hypothetical protein